MRIDPVSARYAEALFRLARAKGALTEVQSDVDRLSAALAKPSGSRAVAAQAGGRAERRKELGALLGRVHPLTQNLVDLLFDRRREAVLAGLPAAFRRRALAERGAVEGVVETARPMAQADVAELARALRTSLGKEVVLENRIAPELLGGARIKADNRMLDASVLGRLQDLRRRLLDAPLKIGV